MKNQTSYKPGQSGNLKGGPKKEHSISQTIRDMMDERPEIKKALGGKILEMAMKGDIVAMKTIWNYMDGMPKQSIDHEGNVDIGMTIDIGASLKKIYGQADRKSTGKVSTDSA